ncbi:hypothetical protein SAMN05421736_10626 [Evansella caseinilytica]|uniref:ABC-2 type transport system permease protein n=1 Tax=Evansella caseinilytica TaxID=1503961 RepID=A0A1H3Q5Q6_9BACI|nr:hypothetical protein [Evansella caseinilytica]SDZ08706.1 hypothetical protein SAMN05421736_10626 [Evansella caseinilytica]
MYAIGKREFFSLAKGSKSLMTISILFLISYFTVKPSGVFVSELTVEEAEMIHNAGLLIFILLFGQLIVAGLSHDSLNREMHERTIRFLVTRTSRAGILFGKFFGVWVFWFMCLAGAFLLTGIVVRKLDLFLFSQTMSLVTFQITVTLLFSVLITKPGYTMFLGIVTGLAFPVCGLFVTYTSNVWVNWLKFVSPYYYLERNDAAFLIIILLAGIMLSLANLIFKRREC